MKEVICFSSTTCAPCKSVKQTLEELSVERNFPLRIVEMKFDNKDVFAQFGVRSVPTVVCVDGEKEVGRFIGATTPIAVEGTLDMWGLL